MILPLVVDRPSSDIDPPPAALSTARPQSAKSTMRFLIKFLEEPGLNPNPVALLKDTLV